MIRDPTTLDQAFDLLVVGGGIYGAWTAWDACLRGLRTALVEADDWGAATSSRSSKLLHGGLRYLERGEVGLVRKALVERERLLRLAPHRAWPLRFLVPATPLARYRGLPLAVGLWAYDTLAPAGLGERRARAWSTQALHHAAPFLHPATAGGWSYGDAGTDDARLVLEIVTGVHDAGGVALNGARVTDLMPGGVRVQVDGRERQVSARAVVVCGGPWAARLAGLSASAVRFTKGVHLALPPLPLTDPTSVAETALLLNHPADGRVFFLIPWYGATLVGTTDTDTQDPHAVPTMADVDYLLAGVAAAAPGLGWGRADVRSAWAGVRTLVAASGPASHASRDWQLVEAQRGVFVSLGGKLTSARTEAEHLVHAVERYLGRTPQASPTRTCPLPWSPDVPWDEALASAARQGQRWGLDAAQILWSLRRHGRRIPRLWQRLAQHPHEAVRPHPHLPWCHAELALAADDMLLPGADPACRTPWRWLTGGIDHIA